MEPSATSAADRASIIGSGWGLMHATAPARTATDAITVTAVLRMRSEQVCDVDEPAAAPIHLPISA
jgi:hypothetical protein